MADVKPMASLGATLLARKGGAKPAMRPQVATTTGLGGAQAAQKIAADLEDLGWNDMGEEDSAAGRSAEVLQLTPAPHNAEAEAETDEGSPRPFVRSMHEELAARLAQEGNSDYVVKTDKPQAEPAVTALAAVPAVKEAPADAATPTPEPRRARASRAAVDSRRAAFTLRLDAKRHLKLRLASTIRNRSAQQLVTEALDRFLSDIPEIELLARNIQQTDHKGV